MGGEERGRLTSPLPCPLHRHTPCLHTNLHLRLHYSFGFFNTVPPRKSPSQIPLFNLIFLMTNNWLELDCQDQFHFSMNRLLHVFRSLCYKLRVPAGYSDLTKCPIETEQKWIPLIILSDVRIFKKGCKFNTVATFSFATFPYARQDNKRIP